ncbi:cytochrome P450 [Penicillium malachiteum]|uniref:cytochrome P450 n=1 Tax=Penicillium malachiteum TaxID=1324776 RepID=UPI0025499933|nr:cytochrome P450 [Penicillium malachiteum]KAJ5726041.1 cytochrome P450 [Penicillium malachiteum]
MRVFGACINETLQIYPAAPGALSCVVPQGGATVSGHWVPGGTRVYTSPLAMFRSSASFHDPDSFLPEQWYTETEEKVATDDRDALKPFSVGTKDCVGEYMVNYLIRFCTREVMLHFDFEPCGESEEWVSNRKIWTFWDKPPLMVKLTPVKPHV